VKIALIDYGAGNLHSARRAFEAGGADVVVTGDPEVLAQADGLVLPGVGAFDPTMAKLQDLREPILTLARQKPFMGICIGLQVLFEGSDEGETPGLGLLSGRCRRFEASPGVQVPHMGWNQLDLVANPLWQGVPEQPWVYFVHSYFPDPADPAVVIAHSTHGTQRFCAAIHQGLIWGTQFHPEKSGTLGLGIIRNFLAQVAAR